MQATHLGGHVGSCQKVDSDSVCLGRSLRLCVSNERPGAGNAVRPSTTLKSKVSAGPQTRLCFAIPGGITKNANARVLSPESEELGLGYGLDFWMYKIPQFESNTWQNLKGSVLEFGE